MIPDDLWPYLVWAPALVGGILIFTASTASSLPAPRRARLRRLGAWLVVGTGLPALAFTGVQAASDGDWTMSAILLVALGSTARLAGDLMGDRPWAKPLMLVGLAVQTAGAFWWACLLYGPKTAALIAVACVGIMIVLSVAIRFASKVSKPKSLGPGAR